MQTARKMDVPHANCRYWQRNLMRNTAKKHRSQR